MKFSPFNFQASLAAGGVTLMAFNWLEFAVPHGSGAVTLTDIHWGSLSVAQDMLYGVLVGLMLVLTVVNFTLTIVFLRDLVWWAGDGTSYQEFMDGPAARVTGIFVPIASLAMTMAVFFAAVPFFIPAVSAHVQALMWPGLLVFGSLLLVALILEARLLADWFRRPQNRGDLTFVWLLDVFAFGLVVLAGTGLAATAQSRVVATAAAVAALCAAAGGSFLLVMKLAILIRQLFGSRKLPERHLQPAFFLVVPITCLYAISYYKIMLYLQTWLQFDVRVPQQVLITVSFTMTIVWAAVTVYLLVDYLVSHFRRSEYFPTQWAMI